MMNSIPYTVDVEAVALGLRARGTTITEFTVDGHFKFLTDPVKILDMYRARSKARFDELFYIKGFGYRHDYRKDFPCGRPRSNTSRDSCFAQYLEDLKVICND